MTWRRCRRATPPRRAGRWSVPPLPDRGAAQVAADTIRAVMWEKSGIDRERTRAPRLPRCSSPTSMTGYLAGATEELNLCETAILIADVGAGAEGIARRASSHRLPEAKARLGEKTH